MIKKIFPLCFMALCSMDHCFATDLPTALGPVICPPIYGVYPGSVPRVIMLCDAVKPLIQNDPAIRSEIKKGEAETGAAAAASSSQAIPHQDHNLPPELQINGEVMVVGDIHGDIMSLAICLSKFESSPTLKMLFLGDYVDRGPFGLEVVTLLFALKMRYPDRIFLLRGNHETLDLNISCGFMKECLFKSHLPQEQISEIQEAIKQDHNKLLEIAPVDMPNLPDGLKALYEVESIWEVLPERAVVNGRFFCVHGGIPEHFEDMDNPESEHFQEIEYEILWNDPRFAKKYSQEFELNEIRKGGAKYFGSKAVHDFIEWKKAEYPNIAYIVRAHEKKDTPNELGNVFTIFSSRYYCDSTPSVAYIMNIKPEGSYAFERLEDVETTNFQIIYTFLQKMLGPDFVNAVKSECPVLISGILQDFSIYQNSLLKLFLDLFDNLKIPRSKESTEGFSKLGQYFSIIRAFLNTLTVYEEYARYCKFDQRKDLADSASLIALTFWGDALGTLSFNQNPLENMFAIYLNRDVLGKVLAKIGLRTPTFTELNPTNPHSENALTNVLNQFKEAFPEEIEAAPIIPGIEKLDIFAKFLKKLQNFLSQA